MESKEGFNPTNYKVFSVSPCRGKFVIEDGCVYPVIAVVIASCIMPSFDEVRYGAMESFYLADVYDSDKNAHATKYFEPEETWNFYDTHAVYRQLVRQWEEGSWDDLAEIKETVLILQANGVPISQCVIDFVSAPFTDELLHKTFPEDFAPWNKKD